MTQMAPSHRIAVAQMRDLVPEQDRTDGLLSRVRRLRGMATWTVGLRMFRVNAWYRKVPATAQSAATRMIA
ncbi:hypothetical protein SAMN04490356_7400 [Streptomyces melanosporofaciens]|uniref:Uncharacterized protein n=1 Tax=Streptomyces melanosporofaciens TaxID=67327 RepID=A0A1H4YQQ0_STRMJ|nr:hypothetical protein SAMN04490356_7400 [Streptomyces melanosporofaciens]